PSASNTLTEGLELLNEIVFHPLLQDEGFNEDIFTREKNSLRNRIEAIIDDKMAYANLRLIDEMCADEKYRLRVHGNEEHLQRLDRFELYTYYKSMLQYNLCDLYVVGDISSAEVLKEIEHIFPPIQTTTKQVDDSDDKVVHDVKEVIEEQDVQQAKLHI